MKRYFITGLATILPFLITLLIVRFVINLLTTPFLGLTQSFVALMIHKIPLLEPFRSPQFIALYSQFLILFFLFAATVFIGFLGQWFLLNTLFKIFDKIMHKIPLVNKVYTSVQDILLTFLSKERPRFSSPVQVPFLDSGSLALAFITNEKLSIEINGCKKELSAVYVPSPPNPLLGFLVLMPKDKISPTSIPVEESIKFIASCGIIAPSINFLPRS